jgi:predicted secreted protein
MPQQQVNYRQGYNLILGFIKNEGTENEAMLALGFSTGCKISDSAETGERITKEPGGGNARWKDKYVKTLSEQITAEGFVYDNARAKDQNLPRLKQLFLDAQPVMLQYQYREFNPETQGLTPVEMSTFRGKFVITSLEQDGPADDDEKWNVTFENCGPVKAMSEANKPTYQKDGDPA